MKKVTKKQGGFNLIELLVVMAIIAVLVALVIAAINIARRASRDTERRSNANAIKAALEDEYAREKTYPDFTWTDLDDINSGLDLELSDPNGEINRYYYDIGTCEEDEAGKYSLYILTEGADGDFNAQAGCGDEDSDLEEDFSNN